MTPERVAALRERLRVGGTLHLATDWADYAAQAAEAAATYAERVKALRSGLAGGYSIGEERS